VILKLSLLAGNFNSIGNLKSDLLLIEISNIEPYNFRAWKSSFATGSSVGSLVGSVGTG